MSCLIKIIDTKNFSAADAPSIVNHLYTWLETTFLPILTQQTGQTEGQPLLPLYGIRIGRAFYMEKSKPQWLLPRPATVSRSGRK